MENAIEILTSTVAGHIEMVLSAVAVLLALIEIIILAITLHVAFKMRKDSIASASISFEDGKTRVQFDFSMDKLKELLKKNSNLHEFNSLNDIPESTMMNAILENKYNNTSSEPNAQPYLNT